MQNIQEDQILSNDEYGLSLKDGIQDETLLESEGTNDFSITSYGADYTVDSLVKRMKSDAFVIPKFQRRFIWSQRHASRFIESLLMGLPIPSVFLYKEKETNTHLVIDGQQRLRTLQYYYAEIFGERKFRLQGVMKPWNGKTYSELEPSDQFKIDDAIIHATIFQQDKPENHNESIYFVFERINSGGIRLSPQEIRNCINDGPFIELIKKLNEYNEWRKIFGPKNKRAKDEEMIIRFFAMYIDSQIYSKPMAKFLNKATEKYTKFSRDKFDELSEIFKKTVDTIEAGLGSKAFRPSGVLNAAVFDAIMSTVAKKIIKNPSFSPEDLKDIYGSLIINEEFMSACARATSDEEVVKKRLEIAKEAFRI